MKGTILLVEDDFALAMGTEYALQAEGYTVIHAGNIVNARKALGKKPDLIILDVMLPDGTGFDFCREIRAQGGQMPVIFLTAAGEEVNIVQGLEMGADDYVTKPYRVKELLSRIAANIRRSCVTANENASDAYNFGSHRFLLREFRLFYQDQPVECTPCELRLLKELIQNEGLVLTRSRLMERLYDTEESFIDDNTLSVYMRRLRSKLLEDAVFIETVRGVGYRFKKTGV